MNKIIQICQGCDLYDIYALREDGSILGGKVPGTDYMLNCYEWTFLGPMHNSKITFDGGCNDFKAEQKYQTTTLQKEIDEREGN